MVYAPIAFARDVRFIALLPQLDRGYFSLTSEKRPGSSYGLANAGIMPAKLVFRLKAEATSTQ